MTAIPKAGCEASFSEICIVRACPGRPWDTEWPNQSDEIQGYFLRVGGPAINRIHR